MTLPRRIVVASGNRHKVREIAATLAGAVPEIVVVGLDAFDHPPVIEETTGTFEGNALQKAEGIATWLRTHGGDEATAVLADDSGLCVDALGGAPGVRSARFAGEHASDDDNNRALVSALAARGLAESPAHYVCVLAWVGAGQGLGVETFLGRWDVLVRAEARGDGGFGYDPHAFLPDGRTVAELSSAEKAERSHRGQALRALLAWLVAR